MILTPRKPAPVEVREFLRKLYYKPLVPWMVEYIIDLLAEPERTYTSFDEIVDPDVVKIKVKAKVGMLLYFNDGHFKKYKNVTFTISQLDNIGEDHDPTKKIYIRDIAGIPLDTEFIYLFPSTGYQSYIGGYVIYLCNSPDFPTACFVFDVKYIRTYYRASEKPIIY